VLPRAPGNRTSEDQKQQSQITKPVAALVRVLMTKIGLASWLNFSMADRDLSGFFNTCRNFLGKSAALQKDEHDRKQDHKRIGEDPLRAENIPACQAHHPPRIKKILRYLFLWNVNPLFRSQLIKAAI